MKNQSFYPNVKQAIELVLTGEEKIRQELDGYVKQKNILFDDHCADIQIAFYEICKMHKHNFLEYLLN